MTVPRTARAPSIATKGTWMRYRSAVLTILAAGITFTPALAHEYRAGRDPSAAAALAEADRASFVHRVYDAYARRSAAGGGEAVDFTLDDFRTVDRARFDEVTLFPDLVTPSGGWELVVVIVIEVRSEEGRPGRRIAFRPEWRQVEDPAPQALLGRPLDDVLGPGSRHLVSRRPIEGVTSYRVRVVHDGIERTYRAAALWMRERDGTPAFFLADNVVPEIALAADDGEGPGSLLADRHSLADPALARWAIEGGTCEPQRTVRRSGHPGSIDGAVSAPVTAEDRPAFVTVHTCSCARDCSQRCEAATEASYDGCRAVVANHRDVRRRALAVVYDVDQSTAPGVPAACSAGMTCDVVECFDGLCGAARVRLEAADGGVRLDTSGGTNGGAGHSQRHTCGRCMPAR